MKLKHKQTRKNSRNCSGKLQRGFCLLLAVLLTLALPLTLGGCGKDDDPSAGQEPQGGTEIPEAYREVLDEAYCIVTGVGHKAEEGWFSEDYGIEGITGLLEFMSTLEGEGKMAQGPDLVGYAVKDISGDGQPELLIGDISEKAQDGTASGSTIYSVYAISDGKALNVLEGWIRNSYDWTEDGSFFNRGSAGAPYYIFGNYTLSKDGTELVCSDYWFTYQKDDSFEEIGCYHNTNGEWKKEVSEEVTSEDFDAAEKALEGTIALLEMTPFSAYEPSETVTEKTPAVVNAAWASDVLANYSDYDEFVTEDASGAENTEAVVFSTDKAISNFKVLSLELADVDDEGNMTFSAKTLYKQKELTPDCPLKVTAVFYGSIPNWGVSYEDADGSKHNYSVSISGEDGSVVMSEIATE